MYRRFTPNEINEENLYIHEEEISSDEESNDETQYLPEMNNLPLVMAEELGVDFRGIIDMFFVLPSSFLFSIMSHLLHLIMYGLGAEIFFPLNYLVAFDSRSIEEILDKDFDLSYVNVSFLITFVCSVTLQVTGVFFDPQRLSGINVKAIFYAMLFVPIVSFLISDALFHNNTRSFISNALPTPELNNWSSFFDRHPGLHHIALETTAGLTLYGLKKITCG